MDDPARELRDLRERIVRDYISCVNSKAISAIEKLYAEEATLEDPAGSEPLLGRTALLHFYEDISFRNVESLELSGSIRITSNGAVSPLRVRLEPGGGNAWVDVIDVFEFDENSRVVSMKAYWG